MKPRFFPSPALFREWLAQHGSDSQELWVGFYEKNSGTPSVTWPEAVDAALCFGWIDGVRKSLSDASYAIRFTPRKAKSTWSAVNIKRAEELTKCGLMQPSGIEAFQQRKEKNSRIYSYEQRQAARLSPAHERRFRANNKAWEFFQRQPPWYRRVATFWVVSAKKEETRLKRLASLIEDSALGRTIRPLTRPKSK
jgi:uncharacterized protein YdeI (YjbR/CyaY-like superfamily)